VTKNFPKGHKTKWTKPNRLLITNPLCSVQSAAERI